MARRWRQGDVLPPKAVESLGWDASQDRLLVVSHSCDLQRMTGTQLAIVAGQQGEADPGRRGGKSIRWLQLTTPSHQLVDYDIDTFCFVDAAVLDLHSPLEAEHHRDHAVTIGRWIGQKYDRLALPDPVVHALMASGVNATLEKALKRAPDGILDVRVHLDESQAPPVLTFLVIHDATARQVAEDVCVQIRDRASRKAALLEGHVTLASSHSVSEEALTYGQWRRTRPWRVEHLSLRQTPPMAPPAR